MACVLRFYGEGGEPCLPTASLLPPHSVLALPPPRRLLTARTVATTSPALGGGVYDDRDCWLDHRYTAERKEIQRDQVRPPRGAHC